MKWDCILIGAGSGGCAAAHQLVKSGRKVLLLEAGGRDWSPFIKFPAGVLSAATNHDWGYRSLPDPSRKGMAERWYRGRVLGGSSSVNGTKYVRGAAVDFDAWAEKCGHTGGWAAADVMPLFRELENSDQPGSLRGHEGPLYVRTVKRPHRVTAAFVESACVAGLPFNEDYNAACQEGVSYTQFSQRRGLRCSAADAFIKPLLGRENLKLMLDTLVEQIEIENDRAVAVHFTHRGNRQRETAKDIILCAGAVNSPKLLMLSGVGDPAELRLHNIDVLHDLPGVGHGFQDQPLVRLVYRSKIPTYNLTEGWGQKIGIALEFILHREGPIANLFDAVAFMKSSSAAVIPDIRLTFLATGIQRTADHISYARYPAMTVTIIQSYPRSHGRIRLSGKDPNAPPLIDYVALAERADVDTLLNGIDCVRRIMNAGPIASLTAGEVMPGADIQDRSGLEDYIRTSSTVCLHSVGSCRMGLGDDAVVGPDLRVRGMENLWIADASIMPSLISADTNATCMMIGMKLGKQLAGRYP